MAMSPKKGFLQLKITDENVLYHSYMPFLKNGGIFIPTNKAYSLGEEVFIVLTLMNESEKIPVAGKISWITPKKAQGNQAAGIGVHFSEDAVTSDEKPLKNKIETYLASRLSSDKANHTM